MAWCHDISRQNSRIREMIPCAHRARKMCVNTKASFGRWLLIWKEGCFTSLLSVSQKENLITRKGCKINVILNITLSQNTFSPLLITSSGFWLAMRHLKGQQDFCWWYTVDQRSNVHMLLLPSCLCCLDYFGSLMRLYGLYISRLKPKKCDRAN